MTMSRRGIIMQGPGDFRDESIWKVSFFTVVWLRGLLYGSHGRYDAMCVFEKFCLSCMQQQD
jgi:hypothetical protein